MKSKGRTSAPREAIVYFRNGTRQKSDDPLEAERPLWLIELEALVPEPPPIPEQPVIYYRDGKPPRRRSGGSRGRVQKSRR